MEDKGKVDKFKFFNIQAQKTEYEKQEHQRLCEADNKPKTFTTRDYEELMQQGTEDARIKARMKYNHCKQATLTPSETDRKNRQYKEEEQTFWHKLEEDDKQKKQCEKEQEEKEKKESLKQKCAWAFY